MSPPANEDARRASRAGYWIGAAIAVAGVLAGVAVLAFNFTALAGELKRLERIEVPGQRVLSLPADKHVVYVESTQGAPAASGIAVTVRDEASGAPLALAPYLTSFTYESGSRSGRAAYTFVTQRAGRYRVSADGPAASGLSVTVGPPLGNTLVSRILGTFGGFGLLFGGPLAGAVVVLVTALRRHRGQPSPGAALGAAGQAGAPPGPLPPAPPAAGWHPDPWGHSRLRWWDGTRWTDHTSA